MLVIYRKDTLEVVHYVDCDGVNVNPTLFGIYHACLKYNYPELQYDDYAEYSVDETTVDENGLTYRDKIISYSKILVVVKNDQPVGLNFVELGVPDPLVNPVSVEQGKEIEELKDTIKKQQMLIEQILKKLG